MDAAPNDIVSTSGASLQDVQAVAAQVGSLTTANVTTKDGAGNTTSALCRAAMVLVPSPVAQQTKWPAFNRIAAAQSVPRRAKQRSDKRLLYPNGLDT